MTTAILDTNVIVQAVISSRGASSRTLAAFFEGRFQIVFSDETLEEVRQVLFLPSIRARHDWSEAEVHDFVALLELDADIYLSHNPASPSLTRDVTDAKFLSLAAESGADYLVTNDRRHLLHLRRHGQTRIVSPMQFLSELP